MTSILGPIQKLGVLLTGLTSDSGDVIKRLFTATPQQPDPADFPALVIEVDQESENSVEDVMGGAHTVYLINIMILVGVFANSSISQLHNKSCAWIGPLKTKFFSNIKLSAVDNVLAMGYGVAGQGNAVFKWRVQGIQWNGKQFYGVRATTWIKEDMALGMT